MPRNEKKRTLKNSIRKYADIACALLMSACVGEVVGEYCTHQCYYVMDFQYGHTTSHLYPALNSTNTFAIISVSSNGTAYKLNSERYGASSQQENVSESLLTQPSRHLGLNNGLIVGRSSFQDDQLYVFDRQCPNCFNDNHRANYPLRFKDALNVECTSCQRVYGLLNGGVVVSVDNGEKLFRYHASYVGTVFKVQNPQ